MPGKDFFAAITVPVQGVDRGRAVNTVRYPSDIRFHIFIVRGVNGGGYLKRYETISPTPYQVNSAIFRRNQA
jgi:hypothetical protein